MHSTALKIDCASAEQFAQPFKHEEKLAAATKRQRELDAFLSKAGATTNVSDANGLCKKLDGSVVSLGNLCSDCFKTSARGRELSWAQRLEFRRPARDVQSHPECAD